MQLSPNDRDIVHLKKTLTNLLNDGLITQLEYDTYIERLKTQAKKRLEDILPLEE